MAETKRVEKRLFQSAHQALRFAFNYSDMQHGNAAAAERAIALQSKERYLNPPSSGRGLVGPDGAAQAGMIQNAVERQDYLTRLIITARFTENDPSTRRAACAALALYARKLSTVDVSVRSRPDALALLLRRHFGMKVNMGRIADDNDVHASTVRRWQVHVLKWIRPAEQRAMNRLERALEDAQVVDEIA